MLFPRRRSDRLQSIHTPLCRYGLQLLVYAGIGLILFLSYALYWGSVDQFIASLDSNQVLFEDFIGHYYPTGQTIFTTARPTPGYFYSPLFAIILAPFSALPLDQSILAWGGFQVVGIMLLLWVSVHLVLDVSHSLWWHAGYTLLFFLAVPLLHNISWGQISVWITALILWSFWFTRRRLACLAALVLSLAVAIKYYPIVFMLAFIVKKDFRTVAYLVLFTLLFAGIIPGIVLGFEETLNFYDITRAAMAEASASWIPVNANSQYWGYVIARLEGQRLGALKEQVFTIVGLIVCLGNVLLGTMVDSTHNRRFGNLMLALFLTSFPFVIKTSWPHYFVYLPYAYFVTIRIFMQEARLMWQRLITGIPLVLSVGLSSSLFFCLLNRWLLYSFYGGLFWANALLLMSLYGCTGMMLRRISYKSPGGTASV